MNVSRIDPTLKLYTETKNLEKPPEVDKEYVCHMISIITKDILPQTFIQKWESYPNYKLDMRGPIGQKCLGGTGLHLAVSRNNLEMTKFFIERLDAKDIDAIHVGNYTPLMCAVVDRRMLPSLRYCETNLKIIQCLLEAGANPNLSCETRRFDGFNNSLLTYALQNSDLPLTKLLLQFGAQKLYVLSPDQKALIKQKFEDKEEEIYKLAKKELRDEQTPAELLHLSKEELYKELPRTYWNLSGRARSSNQDRIDEAKKLIEANKMRETSLSMNLVAGIVI